MELRDALRLAERLSIRERKRLAEILLETLLSSVNTDTIPDEIGWRIVKALRSGTLHEPEPLGNLVYAVSVAEPEKLRKALEER